MSNQPSKNDSVFTTTNDTLITFVTSLIYIFVVVSTSLHLRRVEVAGPATSCKRKVSLPRFSQDRVREAHRLRLSRHHLLQREESVVVRVPRMVQGRAGVSGRRVLVRGKSLGADAGHSLPAAERNGRHESGRAASEGGQYVLHDETADQIR